MAATTEQVGDCYGFPRGSIKRHRVAWGHWDERRMRNVVTHPYVYTYTDVEGYERTYDTRAEAEERRDMDADNE